MSQFIQVLTLGVVATAALKKYRFVSFGGATATAAGNAMGVTYEQAASGERVAVIASGTASVEADGAIAAGDAIEVGANGTAKVQTGTNVVVARAITAAEDGADVYLTIIQN